MDHSRKSDKEIEELKKMLEEHIRGEEQTVNEVLKEIKEMREQLTPLVELWNNSSGFYKVFMWALKTLTIVGAGIGAIIFLRKI